MKLIKKIKKNRNKKPKFFSKENRPKNLKKTKNPKLKNQKIFLKKRTENLEKTKTKKLKNKILSKKQKKTEINYKIILNNIRILLI